MTHSTLTVPGYTPVVPNHVYRKPLPRERGPPDQEVVVVSRSAYPQPEQMFTLLSMIARLTSKSGPGLPMPKQYSILTGAFNRYADAELDAIIDASDECRQLFYRYMPLVSPDQRDRPMEGLELVIGLFSPSNWATIEQLEKEGRTPVDYRLQIQCLGHARLHRARAWTVDSEVALRESRDSDEHVSLESVCTRPHGDEYTDAEGILARPLRMQEIANRTAPVPASGIDRTYLTGVLREFATAAVRQNIKEELEPAVQRYMIQTIADTLKAVKDNLQSGDLSHEEFRQALGLGPT
ncbi:MAG: hypothetical protein IT432_14935 [Phycisphaerales bacterium]|nr:hypothetical protein [Phycisphaerales bacterium]